jgi:heat shock protein HslJ
MAPAGETAIGGIPPMKTVSCFCVALVLGSAGCAGTQSPSQETGRVADAPASAATAATLMNTTWRILSLANEPVSVAEGKHAPQLILKSVDGRDSWSATVGCNQMSGGVAVNGNRVAFKSGMSTLMACPPPLDVLEKQLGHSLLASTQWRIQGNRLELRDDAGVQTFLCEAIPLQ